MVKYALFACISLLNLPNIFSLQTLMTHIIRAYTLCSDYDTVYSGKGEPKFLRIILPPRLVSEVMSYSEVMVVTTMYIQIV